MEEFPPNSQRAQTRKPAQTRPVKKEEEKKVERVPLTGEVIRRKKPLGRRFKEMFVGGDAKGVFGFVLLDVLIPAAKDMVADATSQGIEKALFGDARSTSRRGSRGYGGHNGIVNYSSRYGSPTAGRREEPRISRRSRASHDFGEIILETRVEAEEVIERLFDLINKYEQATVADLFDLVGVQANYTDNKWGWVDFRGAGVTRVRNGYLLDLPKTEPLD